MFFILLFGLFRFVVSPANPAPTNPIKPLVGANQRLALPSTVNQIKTALGRSYDTFEVEDFGKNPGGWGNRYRWRFANGLVLTAQSDGQTSAPSAPDSVRACSLTAPKGRSVLSLAGLVLNKTTKAACQTKFRSAMQLARVSVFASRQVYRIRETGVYIYLIFNQKNTLTTVWQTTFDLEMAG